MFGLVVLGTVFFFEDFPIEEVSAHSVHVGNCTPAERDSQSTVVYQWLSLDVKRTAQGFETKAFQADPRPNWPFDRVQRLSLPFRPRLRMDQDHP